MLKKKKPDLLTLTETAKAIGVSLTSARRAVTKKLWKPDARTSTAFLFLKTRLAELKKIIRATN